MDHLLKCHPFVKNDFVRGCGSNLYDAEGRPYVDFEAGVWCTLLGHGHPRINQIIKTQVNRVIHLGYRHTSLVAEEASVELLNTLGLSDGASIFLSSGSEAVEFALRAARQITGRRLLLGFAQSYFAAYGDAGTRHTSDWVNFDFTQCLDCSPGAGCDSDCERLRDIPFERLAAFVFEPGSASGTVRFAPEKLVRHLAGEIRRQGGMFVVDEVVTGLGRTGKWYGFNHYGLQPDVVICGKGLGNGYPVSAVALRRAVAEGLQEHRLHYVQSHQNDPLGCAVAKEVIRAVREEGLVERSAIMGAHLVERLGEMLNGSDIVSEVRGRGLMAAMQLSGRANDCSSSELVFKAMLARGMLIGHDPAQNVIRFLPCLTIPKEDIETLASNLKAVLAELQRHTM